MLACMLIDQEASAPFLLLVLIQVVRMVCLANPLYDTEEKTAATCSL
jgi:hypothetical protein